MRVSDIRAFLQTCALVFVFLFPAFAFADGMVIPTRAYPIPAIPDQSAMLCCAGGSETLVIETSFAGRGTNFAWIVPLPSAPQIEAVSTGFFPTLRTVFQPRVVLSVRHYWVFVIIAVALLVGLWKVHGEPALLFLFLAGVGIFAVLLFPALTSAKSRSGSVSTNAQVRVLNHQNAGLFDCVTLQSTNAAALLRWLGANGFKVPANIEPVVSAYISDGWVFAAARLRSNTAGGEPQATHPLAFRFKTNRPVYPLRLTALGTKSCRIELYVFGPSRARISGFSVQRCGRPDYESLPGRLMFETGGMRIRNPELVKYCSGASVATKLTATLAASDMGHDAYLGWAPYWPAASTVYTPGAALALSANIGALVFALSLFAWWRGYRLSSAVAARRWGRWLGPAALLCGVAAYVMIPKVSGPSLHVVRVYSGDAGNGILSVTIALSDELADRRGRSTTTSTSGKLASDALEKLCRTTLHDMQTPGFYESYQTFFTNSFTGQFIRFEASPGNFVLRPANPHPMPRFGNYLTSPATNCYELVWHDVDGAEVLTNLVPFF